MRKRSRALGLVAALAACAGTGATMQGKNGQEQADPYQWLEDIHGTRALDWVKDQNARAEKVLKTDPRYRTDYDAVLGLLDAEDRIPMGTLHGDWVFNFWQDAQHVHGIWRRARLAAYPLPSPDWQTLLDVDALTEEKGKSWVFQSAQCSADLTRCLISLSPGGGDAGVVREFDLANVKFLDGGFTLPEAKSTVAYLGDDTVVFGTDFGPGSLTDAGYPRIVKLWRRGTPIKDAQTVFEGTAKDVAVSPLALQSPEGTRMLIVRSVDFYQSEYRYLFPDGSTLKLPLSPWADVKGMTQGQLIATLRKDWTPEGQDTIKEGSLIAFPLNGFLATRTLPKIAVLYTLGERSSIGEVSPGRDAVYATVFHNVTGSVHVFRLRQDGSWSDTTLELPKGGSPSLVSTNDFGPQALINYQSFLTPTTLYADSGDDAVEPIKSLPARFNARPYVSEQYEATSKDSTKIPYFVVRPKNAAGPQPMLLYGYGGFEISLSPWYWSSAGKVWLAQGGAYAVANIRGGGEFGPAWHAAALTHHRQKAFDDFIAVAEDMEKRGLTTTRKLGIMGGSNGGLLVGTVAVERPELFGAVVCQVPLLDMLRYTMFGAGASWIAEYGDPANAQDRAALLKYSPYQNVKPGVTYPPIFFVTATSDDRVTPVHARKMAAKMEGFGDNVLFFENTEGGHSVAADHAQAAEMNALTYVYLAQKLGLSPAD